MNISLVSFLVHIKHVLLACMNVSCSEYLGKMIGSLEGVEVKDSCLRVKVKINIIVLLRCILRVFMEEVIQEVSFLLQYEYLLEFCYHYGLIGHRVCECTNFSDSHPIPNTLPSITFEFG